MKYEFTECEKKNLTEREMKIFEEGNSKQIEAMNAQRVIIEQEAIKSGRYPLWLAVEMMTDNFSDRWVLIDELREDASNGRIPLFRKGRSCKEYRLPLVLKESDEYFWDDLNAWLKEKKPRIDFKFTKPGAPAGEGEAVPVVTGGDDWKVKARAIADKLALERHQRGEREITARNICDAVATELAKDSTTHGIRGERSAGSIRNLALKGWKFIPPTGTNGTSGTKK